MGKVKCQLRGREIFGGVKVQHFNLNETTTIQLFWSEKCKYNWINQNDK
ncbi:MAG: hypothetical protein ACFFE5_10470 [Candidatus Thorarchaeota archaeon]